MQMRIQLFRFKLQLINSLLSRFNLRPRNYNGFKAIERMRFDCYIDLGIIYIFDI